MSDINEIISTNLNKRAAQLELSQIDISKMTGINAKTLNHYFTGDFKAPVFEYLIPICKALNCSIEYLVGLEDDTLNDIHAISEKLKEDPTSIPLVKRVLDIK